MNRSIETRLQRLEEATAAGQTFVMWDASNIDPSFDLAAETERFLRDRGMTDADELILVSWLPPDAAEPE